MQNGIDADAGLRAQKSSDWEIGIWESTRVIGGG